MTKPGSERDRVVNSERGVNARVREFLTEIPGSGRDHPGVFRSPVGLSRNRECQNSGRIDVTSFGKGGNEKTPGGEPLGVFRELVCTASTQNRNELPVLDTYRNFLAKPPIEGLLVLKAIRTFEFAA